MKYHHHGKRHFVKISEQCKSKRHHCYLPVCEIKGSRKQLKQDKEKKNFSVSLFCFHLLCSSFADKWALEIQFTLQSLLFQLCFLDIVRIMHIRVVCLFVRQISAIYLPLPEILLQSPQSKKINHSCKRFNSILLHLPGAFRLVRSFSGKQCSLVYTVKSFKSATWHCWPRRKLCMRFPINVCQGDFTSAASIIMNTSEFTIMKPAATLCPFCEWWCIFDRLLSCCF